MGDTRLERRFNGYFNRAMHRFARFARRVDVPVPRPLYEAWSLRRPLDEIAIDLTRYCNLQCVMCSVWEGRTNGVSLDHAVRLLEDARALGARRFIPCGAEQFMRKDFLDVVEHAYGIGYERVSIVTNGTMITPAHMDRLQRLPIVAFNVSIDGPRAVHDALRGEGVYDKAVATVRALTERGINVALSGVILRETLATVEHIVDLATELGLSSVGYQPFQLEISGTHKDLARFAFRPEDRDLVGARLAAVLAYAEERRITIWDKALFPLVPPYLFDGVRPIPPGGCSVPARTLLVDHLGDVHPCFFIRDRPIGNVHRASLPELWHNEIQREHTRLALAEQCPGCLAACSDVNAFG